MRGAPSVRFRTKQEYVYSWLRDAILDGTLRPGERLVIDDIARRLGVSSIPVREALHLLQSEGFVTNAPHVGATVAAVSADEVREIFTIMEALETVAGREAAARMTPEDAARLRAIVADMDAALARGGLDAWAEGNRTLHHAIGAIAGMPLLQDMTDRVLVRWERLRRLYFEGVVVPRAEQAQREHHRLVEALAEGDADAVRETLATHNRGALRAYADFLDRSNSEA
ncbi:MAG: GntR family transcriptional regulator [Vicinamibacteria bacterium]